MDREALRKAIKAAGGQKQLADAIGINASMVSQWLTGRRPIAAHHCPVVEAATGVRCEELRPDLEWKRDASGDVYEYCVRLKR